MARARQIRRPLPDPGWTGSGWTVFELSPSSSAYLAIEGERPLPSGASIRGDVDRLEFVTHGTPALLNDVEFRGTAQLRSGDVVKHADQIFLVLPREADSGSPRKTVDHPTFMARTDGAIEQGDEFVLLVGRSAAFPSIALDEALEREKQRGAPSPLAGVAARDLLEILAPKRALPVSERFKASIGAAVEDAGETVQWGTATFPRDGGTAEELWAVAVDRMLGLDPPDSRELPVADTVMARLWSLAERIAARRSPLALVGEPGVGRETLARRIRAHAAPDAPFVVHSSARFDPRDWELDVARASGGALHVRRPDILPSQERAAFFAATRFLPSAGFEVADPSPRSVAHRILVPNLRERPADAIAIAGHVLHSIDSRLGRRRTSLRLEARRALQGDANPENVRSLRNRVLRAALSLDGMELRADHLEEPGRHVVQIENLRMSLLDTERRTLEEALQQTSWNVSEAARVMRLPRRTIVYRLKKLGIRRPPVRP